MGPPRLSLSPEPHAAGLTALLIRPDRVIAEPELAAWTAGRVGGAPLPAWALGAGYAREGAVTAYRVTEARVWPRLGAIADGQGRCFQASVGEALAASVTLDQIAHERPLRRVERAAVFYPYGGINYGHYLLDALASLAALEEAGLTRRATVVAPPLTKWQRALAAAAFPDLAVAETHAWTISAGEAVWTNAMDHYLHTPGPILRTLRERLLRAALPGRGGRRLYISRRGVGGRALVNEAGLERALAARGFEIVRPERLAGLEQVRLFAEAGTVIGASGAGLAGSLFAPAGTRVVELLPETFAHPWLRDLCLLLGLDWRGWFDEGPLSGPLAAPWRLPRGVQFAWRLNRRAFLAWLDDLPAE